MLPKQKLIYTNWFHNDCLATYYDCDIYGERHWQIIENFVREAVSEGMNMILTPVLTPPLDTGKGWQRPDVGLVDIYKNGDDYTFEYANLDRWVQMCERCGIEYFEISHLFSQWSAANAPKVTAYVDGAKDKTEIFGWTTDAVSPEYTAFIRAFILSSTSKRSASIKNASSTFRTSRTRRSTTLTARPKTALSTCLKAIPS